MLAPPTGVRPTMDRVKAAIFSMLGDRVPGAAVLDLFAGTGGLGIEALSRGAAAAVFVEQDRRAAEFIRRNLERVGLAGEVRCADVFDYLAGGGGDRAFDLVFADPPYAAAGTAGATAAAGAPADPAPSYTARLIDSAPLRALLATGGLLVLEKAPAEPWAEPPLWTAVRRRRYGATEVVLLEPTR